MASLWTRGLQGIMILALDFCLPGVSSFALVGPFGDASIQSKSATFACPQRPLFLKNSKHVNGLRMATNMNEASNHT
eukprot:753396-Hanusia_phi.AAC.1